MSSIESDGKIPSNPDTTRINGGSKVKFHGSAAKASASHAGFVSCKFPNYPDGITLPEPRVRFRQNLGLW